MGAAARATRWGCLLAGCAAVALVTGLLVGADGATPGLHPGGADCTACHRVGVMPSHPVGIVPIGAVPDYLPLLGGRIDCVTCHDPDAATGAMLRAGSAAALCAECHDPASPVLADQHATAVGRAHLVDRPADAESSGGLDAESASCLGCHDGTVASGAGNTAAANLPRPSWERLASGHPIGVEQRPRPAGDTLLDPVTIDPRVRLFDGRVGCGSCHDPYSRSPGLLAVPNDRSELCLACHSF